MERAGVAVLGEDTYPNAVSSGRVTGKVIVVTGATSGIGTQIAKKLLSEGAKVLVTGRSAARGELLAEEMGPNCHFWPADITQPNASDVIMSETLRQFGRIDALVNNAAIDHTRDLLSVPEHEIRATFETNTFAAIRLLQAAATRMQDSGGSIINITSRLATVGVPTTGIYSATKGALLALTRAAAVELAPKNIRVNAVAPGMAKTPLYDDWLTGQQDPAAMQASVVSKIPLGRLAAPDDVAAAVTYLASDEAAYITGISLAVDGGYTAH